jgi:hypothetical protein
MPDGLEVVEAQFEVQRKNIDTRQSYARPMLAISQTVQDETPHQAPRRKRSER